MDEQPELEKPLDEEVPLEEFQEEVSQMEGFVQKLEADIVEFHDGFAGGISVKQDMAMSDSGGLGIAVGRDLAMSDSGAMSMAIGRDVSLSDGGAVFLTVGGNAEITNGGSMFLMGGGNVTAQNSTFGVVLSSQVNLGEGSKVVLNTKQAIAAGAAAGAVFALLSLIFRRRR